jgi:nitroimidazol reductase NimA-like FMN-containing flavoprotein (pyridoxamine 5'-phosphate oxidase superfamily)
MKYESVVGHGTARFISEPQEKREALEIIMAQYADGCFDFPGDSVARTTVFVVAVEQMTAKSSF